MKVSRCISMEELVVHTISRESKNDDSQNSLRNAQSEDNDSAIERAHGGCRGRSRTVSSRGDGVVYVPRRRAVSYYVVLPS